jgi:adenylate cyclase
MAAFVFAATRLFAGGTWINITQPTLAASVALFGGVGYQYFFEGREKRKMKRLFGQYVSRGRVRAARGQSRARAPRRAAPPDDGALLDIRGITTVSESGQPEEIVAILNEYFTRMVDIRVRAQGTLDKFVGDMVMALFGAPLDDPITRSTPSTPRCQMIRELNRLNEKWAAEGRPRARHRHRHQHRPDDRGKHRVGSHHELHGHRRLGEPGRALESLNKEYGTRIIISEATRDASAGPILLRPLGDVVVKGKTRPVAIFEVKENRHEHNACPRHPRSSLRILACQPRRLAQLGGSGKGAGSAGAQAALRRPEHHRGREIKLGRRRQR